MKIMKNIKLHMRFIKIMKILGYHENHRIPNDNHEIHENHWIPLENSENQENHEIPPDAIKIMKIC